MSPYGQNLTLLSVSNKGLSHRLPELSVYIVSWTRTFEVIVHLSRNHQTTQVVWIFHQMIPNLVVRTVGIMCLAHRAFEVFDHPDLDLTRFVEQRIFPKCDQVLVSCPCGVEPGLA
jgi:hypothetical protein